jgi:N-methylhydantoinase B
MFGNGLDPALSAGWESRRRGETGKCQEKAMRESVGRLEGLEAGVGRGFVDPITFEVVRNSFTAVSNEMALVVARTAYSTPVNEGRDFAGTLYDRHGKLVSQGENDLPAFVGVTQLTVPQVVEQIGVENMEPGDVYMINDPYVAGTHCNDIHLVKPMFHDGGIVAFIASTAHWSDVGGVAPGSLNCRARSYFEEGVRIPAIKILRKGETQEDILKLLLANMRDSWERVGDFNAQLGALRAGQTRFEEIVGRYGFETVLACMAQVQDYSEKLTRAALAALPDGAYHAEDRVDQDIWTGEPKTIQLDLTIEGDRAVFDLTGSDGPAESGINCTIAATTSAVFIALASVLPDVPMNAGVMRAVELRAEKGSVVWAEPPAPISGLAATSMECVVGCVMQALSQALPERGAGSPYSILNTVMAGFDDREEFRAPFISYVWGFGGVGGTKENDGPSVVGSPYTASTQNIPCELQERRFPVLWRRQNFLTDSGGPGASRGGLGWDQVVEFAYGPGTVSCIGNRERFGPPGVFGGGSGGKARLVLDPGGPKERNIGIFAVNEPAGRGERLSFWSAGGGGYGDPLERDPARVLEDVKDGYVSLEAARERYGVVIEEIDARRLDYRVDGAATEKKRNQLREARP